MESSRLALIPLLSFVGLVALGAGCFGAGMNQGADQYELDDLDEEAVMDADFTTDGEDADGEDTPSPGVQVADLTELPAFLHYPGATGRADLAVSHGKGDVYVLESPDPQRVVLDWYQHQLASWTRVAFVQVEAGVLLSYTQGNNKTVQVTVGGEHGAAEAGSGETIIEIIRKSRSRKQSRK